MQEDEKLHHQATDSISPSLQAHTHHLGHQKISQLKHHKDSPERTMERER